MKKILIIEDDDVLRENTAEFIKGQNFEVFVAEDGLIGVQQTLKHLPDLILCDISMPNMNGHDFYKTIKQINATSTIPLVFFSARTENEDIRAGMQLGADDYIIKPFDLFELLKVIKTRIAKYDSIEKFNDEKFYAVLDHPKLGIFIYQKDKFVFYNETLASIFGYQYDEFSFINLSHILEENYCDKTKILNEIDRSLKDLNGSVSLQFEAVQKSLNTIYVELYGSVILYKGFPSLVGNINIIAKNPILPSIEYTKDIPVKLSDRELEVLKLICKGHSTAETSTILFLGKRTIETYRANLLEKTECKNIAELILYAIRNRLIIIEN
jgi:DNA-binding NarL/FixJ family response regulator